jgi:hypothetical protein
MRARLLYMNSELRKQLGVYLWQVFKIDEVKIYTIGRKYPAESKRVYCIRPNGKKIMFYWYEVEILTP